MSTCSVVGGDFILFTWGVYFYRGVFCSFREGGTVDGSGAGPFNVQSGLNCVFNSFNGSFAFLLSSDFLVGFCASIVNISNCVIKVVVVITEFISTFASITVNQVYSEDGVASINGFGP